MRIIALRHGQSEYNLRGLCNDDPTSRVDLTDLGVRQAQAAAEQLAAEPIERIFSSPLLRAQRTAEMVASKLGLRVIVDDRLGDIRSVCDGRPVSEYFRAIAHNPLAARVGDGESLRDYQARLNGFLDWLAGRPWHCVLLVAHEETLRMFRARCEGLCLSEVVGNKFDNCDPISWELLVPTD